jgi:hypothetical protein
MLGRVVLIGVHAQHDRDVRVAGGSADDHALGSGLEMLGCVVPLREATRGLDHDLGPELLPGQPGRIALRRDDDAIAVHDDGIVLGLHVAGVAAVYRVPFEQMGQRLGVRKVVQADDVDVPVACRPEGEPSDPAESVDAHADRHLALLESPGKSALYPSGEPGSSQLPFRDPGGIP